MLRDTQNFSEPVSILPSLGIFTGMFLLFKLLFETITIVINISRAVGFPIIMILLLISSYYAIQFFIKKHKRYFLTSELLFISMGSVMCVWILNALLDGVVRLNQNFVEALVNSAISTLFQSVPIVFAYAYLGRYMLRRFLANEPYVSGKDE